MVEMKATTAMVVTKASSGDARSAMVVVVDEKLGKGRVPWLTRS